MGEPSHIQPAPSLGTCGECGAPIKTTPKRGTLQGCCSKCLSKRLVSESVDTDLPVRRRVEKRWYQSWKPWAFLILAGGLVFAAVRWKEPALHAYHLWSQGRFARRAKVAFDAKDYEKAVADGRRALDFDPFDVETNRIIAKAREAQGSVEAMGWRKRLNMVRPGDPENALAWARGAIGLGSFDVAEDAIAVLKEEDRTSADYHAIAAQIAWARSDAANAEKHWQEALRLNPGSDEYHLQLALLRIQSRVESERASAHDTLTELADITRYRISALRALIEDAMTEGDHPRARKLADRLVATNDARLPEKLMRLAVLRGQDAPDAPEYLEKLRQESTDDAGQLSTLLRWMNQNGLPLLVSDWVPALPPRLVMEPPVSIEIANAYVRDRDWTKLRSYVETAVWKDFEHLRLGYLSHTLENFGNVVAAEVTWGRAILECRERPENLTALVKLAQSWKSDQRAEPVLRKLSTDERSPLWILDALWDIARKKGDSAELHRLSRLIVRARPKNTVARNNFIRLSLLRRENEGVTFQLAAQHFQERPTDLSCAVTHALALFMQGKVFEAMEVLGRFPESELRMPEPALYMGILLRASGDSPRADEYFTLAKANRPLRDEEELMERVKRDSRLNTLTPRPKSGTVPGKPMPASAVPGRTGETKP